MRKHLFKLLLMGVALMGFAASASADESLPTLRVTNSLLMNNTSLLVPMQMGDKFNCDGYSLSPVIPKDKYEFRKDGKAIAIIDFYYGKGGADDVMAMRQGNADVGIFSLPAAVAGIDSGAKIKVISPYILAIGGLTVHKDNPSQNLDEFIDYLKKSEKPVKIGFHSPTSAPILILRSVMNTLGIPSTDDPNNMNAKILYVNLKGISNVQPALASHEVEAFVAPDPQPQLAVQNGYGRLLRTLRELPPDQKWKDFPCCTVSATEDIIDRNPAIVQEFINFLHCSGGWCTKNQEEASKIAGQMLGLDEKAARTAMPVYLDEMTPGWLTGVQANVKVLDESGYLKGKVKGKDTDEIKKILLNDQFMEKKIK